MLMMLNIKNREKFDFNLIIVKWIRIFFIVMCVLDFHWFTIKNKNVLNEGKC